MSDLSAFDVSKKTTSYRQDIFFSLKDMLALGIKGFTSSLRGVVGTPLSGKNQITKELSRWEKKMQRERSLGK